VHTAVNSAFLPFASIEAKASFQALGTTPYGASTDEFVGWNENKVVRFRSCTRARPPPGIERQELQNVANLSLVDFLSCR